MYAMFIIIFKAFFQKEAKELCISEECSKGAIGCMDCKRKLSELLSNMLDPFYQKKQSLLNEISKVREVIMEGNKKANLVAHQTIEEIKNIFQFTVNP
jgi:tryptophanyl-tRNA synthetase